jgi:hypothetical protein
LTAANAAYDELLGQEDVVFHLAYIANLEATFTPLFKMVSDNRRPLFEGGDERAGTLFLWHFVEQIEHRSSALLIHHHVTPDRWFRIRKAPKVFRHVAGIYRLILAGIEQHVPPEARQVPTAAVGPSSDAADRRRVRTLARSIWHAVPGRLGARGGMPPRFVRIGEESRSGSDSRRRRVAGRWRDAECGNARQGQCGL